MAYRLVCLPKSPRAGAHVRGRGRVRSRWLLALLVTIWCTLAFGASAAADDERRVSLARDALHRAQESLQSTQVERDALSKKVADLEAQKTEGDRALALANAQRRSDSARLGADVASLQGERDRLHAELAWQHDESAALQQRLDIAQGRIGDAESRLVEERRLVIAMRTLLQRSVQSVADGERQNHALYDVGQRAIGAFRQCQAHGSGFLDTNAPGLADVRVADVAERLRKEMDGLATAGTAATGSSAAADARQR